MTQFYFDPSRASDPHALPDGEAFHVPPGGWSREELAGDYESGSTEELEPGWYYWACFPGCLPDGDPIGPFTSESEAIKEAQNAH